MIKTNMYQFHRLNTLHRQFEKWQAVEPLLRKFKNREEFLADVDAKYQVELKQITKQKKEYQISIQAKNSNKQSQFEQHRENNSSFDDWNAYYEKNKPKPQKMSEERLKKLLADLDDPMFNF